LRIQAKWILFFLQLSRKLTLFNLFHLYSGSLRRGARAVEWGGLENRCPLLGDRGFESHLLRHRGYP
jgi:hypothetical protein